MIAMQNPHRLNDLSWLAASIIGIIVVDEFTPSWSAAFDDRDVAIYVYDAEMREDHVVEHKISRKHTA